MVVPPLISAILSGDEGITEQLLGHIRINPNQRDDSGKTPLYHAIECGNTDAIYMLLAHPNISLDNIDGPGKSALEYAQERNSTSAIKAINHFLEINKDIGGETLLMGVIAIAPATGLSHVRKQLSLRFTDPNAGSGGTTPLIQAINSNQFQVAQLLLAHEKIDPNLRDSQGRTPLCHAMDSRNPSLIHLLLETPNINLIDIDGQGTSAWAYAKQTNCQQNTLDQIVKLQQEQLSGLLRTFLARTRAIEFDKVRLKQELKEETSDQIFFSWLSSNPSQRSQEINEAIAEMEKDQANIQNAITCIQEMLTAQIKPFENIDSVYQEIFEKRESYLHDPEKSEFRNFIKLPPSLNGETPLTKAIKERVEKCDLFYTSGFHIVEDMYFRNIREFLESKDIDVNEMNSQGETPLLAAVLTNQPAVVEHLLRFDQIAPNVGSTPPLTSAIQNGSTRIIEQQCGGLTKNIIYKTKR